MATTIDTKSSAVGIDGLSAWLMLPSGWGGYAIGNAYASEAKSIGKFYFEAYINRISYSPGIGVSSVRYIGNVGFASFSTGYSYCNVKEHNNVRTQYGSSFNAGDTIGCYLDMDAGTVGFTHNGVDKGVAFTGLSGAFYAGVTFDPGYQEQVTFDFGAGGFTYDPPDGYHAYDQALAGFDGKVVVFAPYEKDGLDGLVGVRGPTLLDGRLHVYSAPVHDVTKHRIDLRQLYIRHTPRAQILNTFSARYSRDWSGYEDEYQSSRALVTATDAGSVAAYGALEGEQEGLNYVTSAGHAQAVIDWRKRELASPRLLVEFSGGYWLTQFRRGDLFCFYFDAGDELDRALLGIVSSGYTRFRVIDMVRRNDAAIQIQGIEVV